MTPQLLCVLVLEFATLWPPVELGFAPAARRPTASTLADVRARVEAARGRLRSIKVEYEGKNAARGESGEPSHVYRVAAAKGVNRYISTAPVVNGRVDDGDRRFTRSFYDGKSWNAFHAYNRVYETSRRFADATFTAKARGEAYLECLGWWPPDDPSDPLTLDGRPFFLHLVLAHPRCRLAADQEEIDGQWCDVVDVPGFDRVWVRPDGMAARRACFAGNGREPSMHYELTDFRPVAAGVVLPHAVRRVEYSDVDHGVLFDMRYRVHRVRVNDVPNSQFVFTPGPGTLVYDRDTDTPSQVPGGLDLMDRNAERVGQFATAPPAWGRPPFSGLAVFGLFALGCVSYGGARVVARRGRSGSEGCRAART